jgi:hypothetical protein
MLSVYRFHDAHKTGSGSARRIEETLALVEKYARPECVVAFHAVAAQLEALDRTWRWCAGRPGLWTLHKLMHRKLYRRHGAMVDRAFSQLHV